MKLLPEYIFILLFSLYGFFQIYEGERIPVGYGYGWDGTTYGLAAKDFDNYVFNEKKPTDMRVQRLLPSYLVSEILGICSIEKNDQNIIKAFAFLNLLLIVFSILLFQKIADHYGLSSRIRLLGLIGLFCNYAVLKLPFYYSALTDIAGLFLGLLVFWGYISKNKGILFLCLITASFTWPILKLFVPILLLFTWKEKRDGYRLQFPQAISKGLIYCFSIGFLLFSLYTYTVHLKEDFYRDLPISYFYILVNGLLLIFFNQRFLTPLLSSLKLDFSLLNGWWMLAIAGWLILCSFFVKQFPPDNFDLLMYLNVVAVSALNYPFYSWVAAAVYFGPLIIIGVLLYRSLVTEVLKQKPEFILFFLLCLIQSFDPESRHLIHFFPIFGIMVLLALSKHTINQLFLGVFSFITLFLSKCYYTINTPDFLLSIQKAPCLNMALDPTNQRYFSCIGVYMTPKSYSINLFYCLGTIALFYFLLRRKPSSQSLANNIS